MWSVPRPRRPWHDVMKVWQLHHPEPRPWRKHYPKREDDKKIKNHHLLHGNKSRFNLPKDVNLNFGNEDLDGYTRTFPCQLTRGGIPERPGKKSLCGKWAKKNRDKSGKSNDAIYTRSVFALAVSLCLGSLAVTYMWRRPMYSIVSPCCKLGIYST